MTKTQSDKDTKLVVTTNCVNSKMIHCDLSMISHNCHLSVNSKQLSIIHKYMLSCVLLLPLLFIDSTHYHIRIHSHIIHISKLH